ncbi:MAG: carboxyl transferase domain-containing protein [Stomatobaculum sp.]
MSHSNDSAAALRIREVLDKNSFVELGAYVTARSTDFNLAERDTPGDGVVTGYGTIEDRLVYIYSQDPAVLGGSVGEMHAKKIRKLYDLAVRMEAPVIGLIDCSGLRLQEASDSLNALGELYRCQTLASGVVPQIQAIYGTCGGSLAVSASIADFTFMEKERGRLFMHTANALSRSEGAPDTASPEFQSAESGVADFVGTASELAEGIRKLVSILPASFEDDPSYAECQDSLNRLVPEAEEADAAALLKVISDDGFVCEPGKEYGACVKTAFIRLNGCTVGAVAAISEELCADGIEKAGSFVRFCDAFSIPLLTLVDASGLEKSVASERQMAKKAAALIAAYAGATVPKVTVVTGKAYGLVYNLFAPKASADIVYAWENAEIGLMNAGDAVKVIYAAELDRAEDKTALYNEKTAAYAALQNGVVSAARRGYVDDMIAPQLTRKRVIAAFEMLFTKNEDVPAKKHGTV